MVDNAAAERSEVRAKRGPSEARSERSYSYSYSYSATGGRIRMFVSRLPYHLIDAGKKKPASIKWEIDQGCTYVRTYVFVFVSVFVYEMWGYWYHRNSEGAHEPLKTCSNGAPEQRRIRTFGPRFARTSLRSDLASLGGGVIPPKLHQNPYVRIASYRIVSYRIVSYRIPGATAVAAKLAEQRRHR